MYKYINYIKVLLKNDFKQNYFLITRKLNFKKDYSKPTSIEIKKYENYKNYILLNISL